MSQSVRVLRVSDTYRYTDTDRCALDAPPASSSSFFATGPDRANRLSRTYPLPAVWVAAVAPRSRPPQPVRTRIADRGSRSGADRADRTADRAYRQGARSGSRLLQRVGGRRACCSGLRRRACCSGSVDRVPAAAGRWSIGGECCPARSMSMWEWQKVPQPQLHRVSACLAYAFWCVLPQRVVALAPRRVTLPRHARTASPPRTATPVL